MTFCTQGNSQAVQDIRLKELKASRGAFYKLYKWCDTHVGSNHNFLVTLKLRKVKTESNWKQCLDIDKLKNQANQEEFCTVVRNCFSILQGETDPTITHFNKAMIEAGTGTGIVGCRKSMKFANTWEAKEERRKTKKKLLDSQITKAEKEWAAT